MPETLTLHPSSETPPLPVDREPLAVTHVVLTLDMGGMERVVLSLIQGGRARGQEVSVLCLESPGALASAAEGFGARVVALNLPGGLRRPGATRAIGEALRELQPDVAHTHQIGALFHLGSTARRAGVPLVVHTEHGDHVSQATAPRRVRTRLILALSGRHARRFFAVSPAIAAQAATYGVVPRHKLAVVPNGIDTERFADPALGAEAGRVRQALGIPADAPVVGTLGRLAEVKRQDVLIRGFARVLPRFPEGRLLIVGDGPLRSELETLAQALGVSDRVHFVGSQPNPEQFLRVMDVFALTSRSEGLPLSILEAWASGVPVVATRVGGIPGLIEPGRTGFLIEPDAPPALADAISSVLADPTSARRIINQARSRARAEFSVEVMTATYEAHYRSALAPRGTSR